MRHSGLHVEATPEIYQALLQDPLPFMALVMRTTRDPRTVAADVRNVVRTVDPDQPVFDIKTMEEVVDGLVSSRRLTMVLLSTFASLAIFLAAIGIYGVISYMVAQRTHEIAVEWRSGRKPAMCCLLSTLLFGVSATDPWTFLAVSLLAGRSAHGRIHPQPQSDNGGSSGRLARRIGFSAV